MTNIFIPFVETKRKEAFNTCRKFGANTIGGEFRDEKEFTDFYNLAHSNSAYQKNCWLGGRLRAFIPYVENSDGTKLLHVVTNTTLGVDYWTPFYVGPAKTPLTVLKPGCAVAYLGVLPYKQNIVAGTSDPTAYKYGDWCDIDTCDDV